MQQSHKSLFRPSLLFPKTELSLISPDDPLCRQKLVKDRIAHQFSGTDKMPYPSVHHVGGSDIFAATMPMADRLEITHVHASPEGDALFPPIDPDVWEEVSREDHFAGPDDDADFTLATYIKR